MSDARRLLTYLMAWRRTIVLALLCSILASVFVGAAVSLINDLVAALAAPQPVAASPPEPQPPPAEESSDPIAGFKATVDELTRPVEDWLLERGYVRVPLAIVALYILKGIFAFFAVYGLRRVGLRTVATLRQEVYDKALRQSDAFYRDHSTGEMYSRILVDVARLQDLLGNDISQALQSIPLIVILLAYALFVSWQITFACVVVIPAFAWAAGRLGRKVKKSSQRSQERAAALTALTEETLVARRVVQAFCAERYESLRFARALDAMLHQDLKVARALAATPPVMELIGAVVGAALIVFAGSLIRRGAVSGSDVFVAIVVLFVVFTHVRRLGQLNNAVQRALASARRIFDILDSPVAITDRAQAREMEPFAREIEFRDVGFSYGRGPVLHDVGFRVGAGEVHALVGASGAGKTTLAMMVPRFIDPTEGAVLIDGLPLRELTVASLRRQIALVTQETHLFDDTIAANIAYGRRDVTKEQLRAAARAAFAEEFIDALPAGFDTRIGSMGGRLSTGQRQRLAIARAFVKNAPILVLDEATSALDAESEAAVQKALDNLLEGRTALIIAHRLSTVARADCIHVLDRGRVVEEGRHAELIGRDGLYARLHELQLRSSGGGR